MVRKEHVEALEDASTARLLEMIGGYAPHLAVTFVISPGWWKARKHMPEAHVSYFRFAASVRLFNSLQMFKHLLLKGIHDILSIFINIEPENASVIETCLKEANEKAAPLWRDKNAPFATRVKRCGEILDPVFWMNDATYQEPSLSGLKGIPQNLLGRLDEIFTKFYGTPDKLLLIGRTHDEAYEAQDGYSREVACLLGTKNPWYRSRAMTCLGKMYGRNSIPLLTSSSVTGLWELCRLDFYKDMLSLVSPAFSPCRLPC